MKPLPFSFFFIHSREIRQSRELNEVASFFFVYFGAPHGCDSGREDDSVGYPTPESADASDAEPAEGESQTEKTKGVGFNPNMLVRRLASGREGVFLLSGKFR